MIFLETKNCLKINGTKKNHRPACRSPNRQRPAARPIWPEPGAKNETIFRAQNRNAGGQTNSWSTRMRSDFVPGKWPPPSGGNFWPLLIAVLNLSSALILSANATIDRKIMKKSVLFNNIYIKIDKNENKWINNKTIRPKVTVKIKNMCKNHVSHRIE